MCDVTGTSESAEEEQDCAGKSTKLMTEEPKSYGLWAMDIDSPEWKTELRGADRGKWLEAMQCESSSLSELGVYELVERTKDRDVITGK
jgi:hypothetical protein